MANTKIKATAQLFLDTSNAKNDAKKFVTDLKQQLNSIETAADKMNVFKELVGYIGQVDNALTALRTKNGDAFKHMFDGMDENFRKQFEDLFGLSGDNLQRLDVLREKLATLTPKSGIAEIRKFATELNKLFTSIGADAPLNIDEFKNKATQGQIDSIISALGNFETKWAEIVSRLKDGLGVGSSGVGGGVSDGIKKSAEDIKTEINNYEAQIQRLKNLKSDISNTLSDFNKFNEEGTLNIKFNVDDIKNSINEVVAAKEKLDKFVKNGGDTKSIDYQELLSQYLHSAVIFSNIFDELATASPGSKRSEVYSKLRTSQKTLNGKNITIADLRDVVSDDLEGEQPNILSNFQNLIDIQISDITGKVQELRESFRRLGSDNSVASGFAKITQEADKTAKATQKIMYHLGNLLSGGGNKRDTFGDMPYNLIDAAIGNSKYEQYGFGVLGGGLFGVSDPSTIDAQKVARGKFLHSIDLSKYNMYIADTEERATNLIDFLSILQKYAFKSAEPNYTGFDEQLKGVNIDTLYDRFKVVFNEVDLTKEKFNGFINEMVDLLRQAGLKFDANEDVLDFESIGDLENSENISTRFMKMLGYQGVNVGGTSFDGFAQGSVLFDFDSSDIVGYFNTAEQAINDFQKRINDVSWDGSNEQLMQYRNSIDSIIARLQEYKTIYKDDTVISQFDTTIAKLSQVQTNIDNILSGKSINNTGNLNQITFGFQQTGDAAQQAAAKLKEFYELVNLIQSKYMSGEMTDIDIGQYTERLDTAEQELKSLADQGIITAEELDKVNNALVESKDTLSIRAAANEADRYLAAGKYNYTYASELYQEEKKNEVLTQENAALRAQNDDLIRQSTAASETQTSALQQQLQTEEAITAEKQKQVNLATDAANTNRSTIPEKAKVPSEASGRFTKSVPIDDTASSMGIADETAQLNNLLLIINQVKEAVDAKTKAFKEEYVTVDAAVEAEISALNKLKTVLDDIKNSMQFIFSTDVQKLGDVELEKNKTNGETASGVLQSVYETLCQILAIFQGFTGIKSEGKDSINYQQPVTENKTDSSDVNKLSEDIATENTLSAIKGSVEQIASSIKSNQSSSSDEELHAKNDLVQLTNTLSAAVKTLKDVASGIVQHQTAQKSDTRAAQARLEDPAQQDLIRQKATDSALKLGTDVQIATLDSLTNGLVRVSGAFKNVNGEWEGFTVKINEANEAVDLAINKQSAFAKSLNNTSKQMVDDDGNPYVYNKDEVEARAKKHLDEYTAQGKQATVQFKDSGRYTITVLDEIDGLAKQVFQTFDENDEKIERTTATISNSQRIKLENLRKIIDSGLGNKNISDQDTVYLQYKNAADELERMNGLYRASDNLSDEEILNWNAQIRLVQQLGSAVEKLINKRKSAEVSDVFQSERGKQLSRIDLDKAKLYKDISVPQSFEQQINDVRSAVESAVDNDALKVAMSNWDALKNKINAAAVQQDLYIKKTKDINEKVQNKLPYGSGVMVTQTAKRNNLLDVFGKDKMMQNSSTIANAIEEYNAAFNALQEKYNNLKDAGSAATQEDKIGFRQASEECSNLRQEVERLIKTYQKEHNGADVLGVEKLDDYNNRKKELEDYVRTMYGTKAAIGDFNSAYTVLTFTIDNGDGTFTEAKASVDSLRENIVLTGGQIKQSVGVIGSVVDQFKKKWQSLGQYLSSVFSWRALVGQVKKGVQYVREIDSALTELKKVTNETDATYDRFLQNMSKTAGVVGSTVKDLTTMAAEWARLGYSLEESAQLAESTAVLLNVSEFSDATTASKALISTMQAFSYTADESMHVVDILNEVGNNYAVSSDGIATALQTSASALMEAGNSLEQSTALVAAANKVVQDPSSVGSALRTISLRLRGTSVSVLEELGEETDGVVESTSKLQEKLKALTGVDILTSTGAYKDTYTILKEMGEVWQDLDSLDQSAALELMAGKNRANTLSAILNNTQDLENAYKSAMQAEGSALKENETYLDSIQGRIDILNNSVQTMWMNFISSDTVKFLVDVANALVKIVDQVGVLQSALIVIMGYKTFFKKKDWSKSLENFKKGFGDIWNSIFNKKGQTQGMNLDLLEGDALTREIEVLNQKLKEGPEAFNAYVNSAQSARNGIQQYAQQLNGGAATVEGYTSALRTMTTEQQRAAQAAQQAAKKQQMFNAIYAISSIVFATIGSLIKNKINNKEDINESYEKIQSNISSLESDINSLDSSLSSIQDKISEMSGKKLTLTEAEELQRLKEETAELERQKEIKKTLLAARKEQNQRTTLAKIDNMLKTTTAGQQDAVEDAKNTGALIGKGIEGVLMAAGPIVGALIGTAIGGPLGTAVGASIGGLISGGAASGLISTGTEALGGKIASNKYKTDGTILEWYKSYQKAIEEAEKEAQKAESKYFKTLDDADYDKWQKKVNKLSSLQTELYDGLSEMQDYIADLDYNDTTAPFINGFNELMSQIEVERVGDDVQSRIDALEALRSEYKALSKGIDENGNNVALSSEEYARYQSIIKQVLAFSPELVDMYGDESNAIAERNSLIDEGIKKIQEQQRAVAIANKDKIIEKYRSIYDNTSIQTEDYGLTGFQAIVHTVGVEPSDDGSREDYVREHLKIIKAKKKEILDFARFTIFDDNEYNKFKQALDNSIIQLNDLDYILKNELRAVPQASEYYFNLDGSQLSFIDSYINSLGNLSDLTDEEITNIISNVSNLTDTIGSDENAQELIDGLFTINPDVPAKAYGDALNEGLGKLVDAGIIDEDQKEKMFAELFPDSENIDTMMGFVKQKLKDEYDANVDDLSVSELKIAYKFVADTEDGSVEWDDINAAITANQAKIAQSFKTYSTLSKSIKSFNTALETSNELFTDGAKTTKDYFESLVELGVDKTKLSEVIDPSSYIVTDAAKLKELVQAQKEELATEIKLGKAQARLKYHDLVDELGAAVGSYDEFAAKGKTAVDSLLEQMYTVKNTINQYQLLEESLLGITNAFEDFTNAQELDAKNTYGGSYVEMAQTMYDAIYKTGEVGSEAFWAAVRANVPEEYYINLTPGTEQISAIADYLNNNVFSTLTLSDEKFSIDYSAVEDFIEKAQDVGVFTGTDASAFGLSANFMNSLGEGEDALQAFADKMGWTKTQVYAMLSAMDKYNADGLGLSMLLQLDKSTTGQITLVTNELEKLYMQRKALLEQGASDEVLAANQQKIDATTAQLYSLGEQAADIVEIYAQVDKALEDTDQIVRDVLSDEIIADINTRLNIELTGDEKVSDVLGYLNDYLTLLGEPTVVDLDFAKENIETELEELKEKIGEEEIEANVTIDADGTMKVKDGIDNEDLERYVSLYNTNQFIDDTLKSGLTTTETLLSEINKNVNTIANGKPESNESKGNENSTGFGGAQRSGGGSQANAGAGVGRQDILSSSDDYGIDDFRQAIVAEMLKAGFAGNEAAVNALNNLYDRLDYIEQGFNNGESKEIVQAQLRGLQAEAEEYGVNIPATLQISTEQVEMPAVVDIPVETELPVVFDIPIELSGAYKEYKEDIAKFAELGFDPNQTKFGNIDTNNRQVLEWDENNLNKYKNELMSWYDDLSWDEIVNDFSGTLSTVMGASSEFFPVEIAFSPILQTENGPVLLDENTVSEYMYGLIDKAGTQFSEGWTGEDLLRLDVEGLEVDGQRIKGLIADVGDTAIQTGEAMHYAGTDGSIAQNFKFIEDSAKEANMSVEDMMLNLEKNANKGTMIFPQEVEKIIDSYMGYISEIKKGIADETWGQGILMTPEQGAYFNDLANKWETLKELKESLANGEDPNKILAALYNMRGTIVLEAEVDEDSAEKAGEEIATEAQAAADSTDVSASGTDGGIITFKSTPVKSYSQLETDVISLNSVLSQSAETLTNNTKVTQEYKNSLLKLCETKEEIDELNKCFDTNTGLIVKNSKELKKLIQEKNKELAIDAKLARSQSELQYYDLYKELSTLTDGIEFTSNGYADLTDAQREQINSLYEEMNAVSATVAQFASLEAQLLGTTNAFTKFKDAQTIDTNNDYISQAESMLLTLGQAFDEENLGTASARAAFEGLVPESVYADLDTFEERMDAIFKYLTEGAVSKYFSMDFDDDGNISKVETTVDDLKQFVADGVANGIFVGDWEHFDFAEDVDSLKDVADAMGVTEEVAYALIQALESTDAGNLFDPSNILLKLTSGDIEYQAYQNTKSLAELNYQLANGAITAEEYNNRLLGLDGQLSKGLIAQQEYDDSLQKLKEQLEAGTISQQEYNEAVKGLSNIQSELSESAYNEITAYSEKSAALEKCKKDLEDYNKQLNDLTLSDEQRLEIKNNIEETTKKMNGLIDELSQLEEPTEMVISLAMEYNQGKIDEAENSIIGLAENNEISVQIATRFKEVEENSFDLSKYGLTKNSDGEWENVVEFITEMGLDPEGEGVMDAVTNYLDLVEQQHTLDLMMGSGSKDVLGTLSDISTVLQAIADKMGAKYELKAKASLDDTEVNSFLNTPLSKTISVGIKKVGNWVSGLFANGTVHENGTAHAQGSWGAPKSETALVGELGPEIVVRDGRWFTVGENGAEFADIKQNDIIFNHKQTEDLLSKGYVTGRGKAFAEGTAYGGIWHTIKSKFQNAWKGSNTSSGKKKSSSSSSKKSSSSSSKSDASTKNLVDWFEIRLKEINEQLDLMKAKLENAVSINAKNSLLDEIINVNKNKLSTLKQGLDLYTNYANKLLQEIPAQYREMAQNGAIAIDEFAGDANKETKEAITNYRTWAEKVATLTQEMEELNTEISTLAKQKINTISENYQNKTSLSDNKIDQYRAYNSLLKTDVGFESEAIYRAMINDTNKIIATIQEQRNKMQEELNKQVESGNIKKYSQDWYDVIKDIAAIDKNIIELKTDTEDWQDAINDLHFDKFDLLIDKLSAVDEEADKLIDVLSSKDLVNKDTGEWTDEGITTLGLYAQKMDAAEVQAKKYEEQIKYLNKNWKKLGYTEKEYIDKLEELKNGQYNAIKAYNDTKDAIVDLNKERVEAIKDGIQKEIDAYTELINKKKEELLSEKDLYDFQKSVSEKQKDIAKIQRQLAALAGDNSASARAKRAQLEAELLDAQADLEETYYDRSVSNQQEALDKELENFEDAKNDEMEGWDEYLENTNKVVADSLDVVKANTDAIYQELQAMGQEYGLSITESLTSPWKEGENAIQAFSEKFGLAMSATVDELKKLESEFLEIMIKLEKAGSESVDTVKDNASNYQGAEYKPPKEESSGGGSSGSGDSGSGNGGDSSGKSYPYGKASETTGNIKEGAKGNQVKAIQYALNQLGYGNSGTKNVDGKFGSGTKSAVKAFQRAMGISADGIVGKNTRAKFKAKGYKFGTTGVDTDQFAWIDEMGLEEIVLHAQDGKLAYLTKGSAVLPHSISENLMKLGQLDPQYMLDINRPQASVSPSIINNTMELSVDNSIGTLISIENFDGNNPDEITKVVNKALEQHTKNLNNALRKFAR